MVYDIQPSTRRCTQTGRELIAGERYYSALVEDHTGLVRHDYSPEAWQGPPEGAIAFWQARVAAAEEPQRPTVPHDVLLGLMDRLDAGGEAMREDLKYLLALWLVRRKQFQLVETRKEAGTSRLEFRCRRTGRSYKIAEPKLVAGRLEALQQELMQLLGGEGIGELP